MRAPEPLKPREARGQKAKAQCLASVIQETFRLWRKYHLGYDQTKYVVEEARRRLGLEAPHARKRTVERLDRAEVELSHCTQIPDIPLGDHFVALKSRTKGTSLHSKPGQNSLLSAPAMRTLMCCYFTFAFWSMYGSAHSSCT